MVVVDRLCITIEVLYTLPVLKTIDFSTVSYVLGTLPQVAFTIGDHRGGGGGRDNEKTDVFVCFSKFAVCPRGGEGACVVPAYMRGPPAGRGPRPRPPR